MKTKKLRFHKHIMALALTLVMCLGLVAPAYALVSGSETNPANAAIAKVMEMPEGTTTPAATFTFKFTKLDMDGKTAQAELDKMPTLLDKTITYASADAGVTATGIKLVSKEVSVLSGNSTGTLDGEYASTKFPHAGIYSYTLKEDGTTGYTIADATKESLVYSKAEYKVTFYVENKTSGGGTYVKDIEIHRTKEDDGTAVNPGSGKVNGTPTPGGPNGPTHSDLAFTNKYTKTNGGGGDPTVTANQVLNIKKLVAGSYADKTKFFDFDLTLTKPATVSGTVKYKAYIVSGSSVETSTDNNANVSTDANGKKYIEVTAGSPVTIKLKHDQSIVFTDLPVGSKYVAVEAAVADYTATLVTTIAGATISRGNTTHNAALSTGPDASTAGDTKIGEDAVKTNFTNTFKTVTPTGISIDNLPFIMLLAMAIGGFVVFVVAKSRKRHNNQ